MVTDSKWADVNNDDEIDLVVVGDWMPITVFLKGLDQTSGLWNSIEVADIDGNGQNDLIAGNAGLNIKFKASVEKPVSLYLDDFDGNGSLDPIIFYDFFGNDVPFASKDKLTAQMPSLKKKFLDYEVFSKISSIQDLTSKKTEDILEIKKITELRSMAFMNSNNTFEAIPLPKEAQMSSIEDIHVKIDNGQAELFFVGNYLDYTNELGQSDANSGGVLTYAKDEKFKFKDYLPLPAGLNSRKIISLGENKFLVVSNNDKSYLIEVPSN